MSTPSIPAPGPSSADATGAAARPAGPPGSVILEMRAITKEFPGVKALSDVILTVRARRDPRHLRGERRRQVHPDEGALGRLPVRHLRRRDRSSRAQLVRVQRHPRQRARRHRDHPPGARAHPRAVDRREHLPRQRADQAAASSTGSTTAQARQRAARPGRACDEDPDTQIKDIGVGKQQLVEIAKALSKDVKLLILDEPTAALNEADSQHLLGPHARACSAAGIT